MAEQPKQPATKAGQRALADILAAHFGPEDLLADRILAIEAEAAAGLLALREALLDIADGIENEQLRAKLRALATDEATE